MNKGTIESKFTEKLEIEGTKKGKATSVNQDSLKLPPEKLVRKSVESVVKSYACKGDIYWQIDNSSSENNAQGIKKIIEQFMKKVTDNLSNLLQSNIEGDVSLDSEEVHELIKESDTGETDKS